MEPTTENRKPGRWGIDTTKPCPLCGAKCVGAGELAFTRKTGEKWCGPFAEYECGLFIVQPGAGTNAELPPEFWNACTGISQNGKPVVDIPAGDYEIREGKPIQPEPVRILIYQTASGWGTSSSTSTFF